MDIIKEIINCETNKKFIKTHDDGRIEIPDVPQSIDSNSCDYLPQAISSLPIISRTVFLENAPAAT